MSCSTTDICEIVWKYWLGSWLDEGSWFLICAVSMRRKLAILTTDKDFAGFARVLGFELHAPR